MPWWPVLVFGWGAVAVAATAFCLAVYLNRPWLAYAGAVAAVPFLVTVSGYPRVMGPVVAPVVLVANFASAAMVSRGHRRLATLLLAPFVIVVAVLVFIVMTQMPPRHSDR